MTGTGACWTRSRRVAVRAAVAGRPNCRSAVHRGEGGPGGGGRGRGWVGRVRKAGGDCRGGGLGAAGQASMAAWVARARCWTAPSLIETRFSQILLFGGVYFIYGNPAAP